MAPWTDHITSSHMYFRGLKHDMHAIVILNHSLGKLDPRSVESLTQGEGREGLEGGGTETGEATGAGGATRTKEFRGAVSLKKGNYLIHSNDILLILVS